MRSNSGRDESENNMRDPTIEERVERRGQVQQSSPRAKAPADQRRARKD